MPFIGNQPAKVPLTSADITDNVITSAKIVDGTITNTDIASSIITGQTAETSIAGGDSILIYDDSATALRKMTRTNFVSGLGAAAGQVIQVVTATDSTERTTTSTSYVTASNTLSASITPSSTSNKIAIFVTHFAYNSTGNSFYTIFRGATNLGGGSNTSFAQSSNPTDGTISYIYLDSPNTTSATTYQPYIKVGSGTGYLGSSNSTSSIIVFEIKG